MALHEVLWALASDCPGSRTRYSSYCRRAWTPSSAPALAAVQPSPAARVSAKLNQTTRAMRYGNAAARHLGCPL